MAKALYYPKASRTAQWFADDYPGVIFSSLHRVVLHTTEGSGWPGYSGGANAPTFTALPDYVNKRLIWRQHFPMNMSARALVNAAGGVNTNTANIVQVELVGTCDEGGPGMYWPSAPDWALDDLADFLKWVQTEWLVPARSTVRWVDYPSSYGNGAGQRLSGTSWLAYRGVLGHQHVPENHHGDPGAFPWARLTRFLQEEFVLATKEEVKAALAEVIAANLDDIGRAVVNAPVGRMWDGKSSGLGAMLSSAQYYAIQGGFRGVNPETASSSPGAPTVANSAAAEVANLVTNQKTLAENQITMQKNQAELLAKVDALAALVEKLLPTQPTT